MTQLGLVRAAAVTPVIKVANTEFNTQEIIQCINQACEKHAGIILLPELCITGYTCGDLFFQQQLYNQQLEGLKKIVKSTNQIKSIVIVGLYIKINDCQYNCAAIIQSGKIKGIVPKMFLPNTRQYYETRWFASGLEISEKLYEVNLFGKTVPFGNLIFGDSENQLKIGVEICQDLFMPITPGARLCMAGAHIICNLSASDEIIGKAAYRKNTLTQRSTDYICGYVYSSSGVHESSTDMVFSGHSIIAEKGIILSESQRFQRERSIIYGELDYELIKNERAIMQGFAQCETYYSNTSKYKVVCLDPLPVLSQENSITRTYSITPFIPEDKKQLKDNCMEAFSLQSAALAKRLSHTGSRKAVIGISGGLDSTLALLVVAESFKLLGKNNSDIITVTMPGFGTTETTYSNALKMMKALDTDIREISIKESVLKHFEDIGHDPNLHNVVYENAQARERTQILMDLANKEKGVQIGTGDLSEAALGWSTYNGDHMSMYNVNAGVPKTLIREILKWIIYNKLSGPNEDKDFSLNNKELASAIQGVLDTPISPELLPPDKDDNITQKTEDKVGPYILNDFFLYHTIRYCTPPEKLLLIAKLAFKDSYDHAFIKNCLTVFYRRFFSQQFKRSSTPDGPKIGSISLSARGDWKMPSDADVTIWLNSL